MNPLLRKTFFWDEPARGAFFALDDWRILPYLTAFLPYLTCKYGRNDYLMWQNQGGVPV